MSPVHGIIGHVSWPRFQSIRSWQLWLAACWRSVRTVPAEVVEPKTSFEDLLVTVRKSCFCMVLLRLWYGLRLQPRISFRWPVRLSFIRIVDSVCARSGCHHSCLIYEWIHPEAYVGRHLLWMWFGVVQMVGSGTLFVMKLALTLVYIHSKATIHRHPHCTCGMQHAPNTGTTTYAQKSWGGHPRCDLAPLTTSFGIVGQWERQHLAMTATCPEGEAWAASRNWNHGTHFLWDPRAAPTFHPPSTLRHRAQCRTCQPPRSTLVLYSTRGAARVAVWRHVADVLAVGLMDTRCFLVHLHGLVVRW